MGTATGIGVGFDNINLVAGAPADLSVTKSGPATATTGAPISYTITVTNAGPNPALDAELTDTLPAGTTFASLVSPAGWSCTTPAVNATGTVIVHAPSVPIGPGVFTLNVNAPATPTGITNTATVASANEGAPGNESASASTTINGVADLAITKTGAATATTGAVISYTVTVTNAGPDPALAAQLTDTLPAGTTFTSLVSPAGWTCATPTVNAPGTVTCTRASVPIGPAVFTLNVNAPATPTGITNTATVASANESAPGNESASASTTINGIADLAITKTGAATATTGAVISYTVTVTNAGPDPALAAQLTDTLPAGTTFTSLVSPAGWTCATPAVNAPGTVTCTRASVPIGPAVFTLNVNAPATPTGITNTATVASANESAPGNESASASTTVNGVADLAITKTATTPTGGQIVYTISISNSGPAAATSVVVTDIIPAGVAFDSATPSQGSCSGATTVTCNLGTLPNGSTATITLVVTVTATSGSIENTATVSSNEVDPTPANATATATAEIPPPIPTISSWAFLALAAMLGLLALTRLRKRMVLPAR